MGNVYTVGPNQAMIISGKPYGITSMKNIKISFKNINNKTKMGNVYTTGPHEAMIISGKLFVLLQCRSLRRCPIIIDLPS